MGIITNLFVVGFFIIALVIGFSTLSGFFTDLIDDASGFFTATELKPKPEVNEIICDLRVKVFADLDMTLPFSTLFARIDPNNSHEWTYFECFSQGNFPAIAQLDFGKPSEIQGLDFLTLGGETVSVMIVLRDANDPTQKVDAFTQPQLRREVPLGEDFGIIATPFSIDSEFVVKNIPLREYDLEIFIGREIFVGEPIRETITAGDPFVTKICDQFSRLELQSCFRTG